MKEMNLCNGCFYAGTTDGFKPECVCKAQSEYVEAREEAIEEQLFHQSKYIEVQEEDKEKNVFYKPKTSYQRHIERRRNRRKANTKAIEARVKVEGKYKKLPANAKWEDILRIDKKCKKVEKKAKRNKQITITLFIPETIGKMKDGSGGSIAKLKSWMKRTPAIATECQEAIKTLELAKNCDGEIVAAFRREQELHLTIGFYSKKALSNFKRKCEKAS